MRRKKSNLLSFTLLILAGVICAVITFNSKSLADQKAKLKEQNSFAGEKFVAGLKAFYKPGKANKIADLPSFKPTKAFAIKNVGLGFVEHPNKYCVWLVGAIKIDKPGYYEFTLGSDDPAELYIAGNKIATNTRHRFFKMNAGKIKLNAGYHKFKIAYRNTGGRALLHLYYKLGDSERKSVPTSWFYREKARTYSKKIKLQEPANPRKKAIVKVDISRVPTKKKLAKQIEKMILKTYPKVIKHLVADDFQVPSHIFVEIHEKLKYPAAALGNKLFINADWLRRFPGDIGMIAHELAHVVQAHPGYKFWICEGTADYIRYEMGYVTWWSYPRCVPGKSSYKKGYGEAAAFLKWIEQTYDKQIVRKLNKALREQTYNDKIFVSLTKKNIDQLWSEFVEHVKKNPLPVPKRK